MVNQDKKDKKISKRYGKEQILHSGKYGQGDLLEALLKEGETYSHDQVQTILAGFLKKEVR
ncbi:hypothetical protein Desor_5392 [Desulfosporosinus orientis DSM 765]|uniref:Uncharacterized protein n=1 Tax=Desulfosporosinus orientis (strain ATCC 19365 / DSM 765 / NCIMB 8382 / VKM B-1628 / Singapore I) TaxID=768706 RepID=G7WEF5_DESOD|nr:hypothetical protein [Desulfosporosinus orientis]AET70768.1 hypothetical protein Desor_5392 [Desulfosporosinus orientis DSM 765]